MSMKRVSIKDVYAAYPTQDKGQNVVLNHIDLEINPNDFVVVVGPSGCGKTTLLNLLAGFEKPIKGVIQMGDAPILGPSPERGVIFQQNALLPWLSVQENIEFGLKIQGKAKAFRTHISHDLLNLVGLNHYANHRIWELSGGMKQRVALARSLATNPDLLLMDEPFGALDAFIKEQMQQLILNVWNQTKKQIFFVTHDIEEAVFLWSKLVLMKMSC
jgi:ABC-type taurine transport system ATPase subunit